MALADDQAELAAVRAEIAYLTAEHTQGYEIRARSLTRADIVSKLELLHRRQDVLEMRVARAERGGIRGRLATPV